MLFSFSKFVILFYFFDQKENYLELSENFFKNNTFSQIIAIKLSLNFLQIFLLRNE